MNINKLMKQAQQMQERMQRELQALEVEATAGGGMVTVRMNGHKELLGVTIDPEVLDPQDPEMLQDLVVAAVNEAIRKAEELQQSQLGGAEAGGFDPMSALESLGLGGLGGPGGMPGGLPPGGGPNRAARRAQKRK
jgi:nucleoid-associated protein EbfC